MSIYCSLRITVFIRKFLLTKEREGWRERESKEGGREGGKEGERRRER